MSPAWWARIGAGGGDVCVRVCVCVHPGLVWCYDQGMSHRHPNCPRNITRYQVHPGTSRVTRYITQHHALPGTSRIHHALPGTSRNITRYQVHHATSRVIRYITQHHALPGTSRIHHALPGTSRNITRYQVHMVEGAEGCGVVGGADDTAREKGARN